MTVKQLRDAIAGMSDNTHVVINSKYDYDSEFDADAGCVSIETGDTLGDGDEWSGPVCYITQQA